MRESKRTDRSPDVNVSSALRVFVCGSFADLREERGEVLAALREMQQATSSMEYFGADPDMPIEVCLREVRNCDVIVVIVGYRYGSVVPGLGISFTEAEYDEAYRLRKRCLVYARDLSVPVELELVERDEASVELLRAFTEKLRARHSLHVFPDAQKLAVRVAIDLSRVTQAMAKEIEWVEASPEDTAATTVGELVGDALALGMSEQSLKRTVQEAISNQLLRLGLRQPSVFLSYTHGADSETEVVALFARTLEDLGLSVWYDRWAVDPGESIVDAIREGMTSADVIVFFVTARSPGGDWTQRELDFAINRLTGSERRTAVVPALLSGTEVPSLLRDSKYLDLRTRDVVGAAHELVRRMRADLPWQSPGSAPTSIGMSTLSSLPIDLAASVQDLPEAQQLHILSLLADVNEIVERSVLNEEMRARVRSAVEHYVGAATDASLGPEGSLLEVVVALEIYLVSFLRAAAVHAYGIPRFRHASTTLRIGQSMRHLTLGRAAQALEIARDHPDFAFLAGVLTDDELGRLRGLVELRNNVAHSDPSRTPRVRRLETARQGILSAVRALEWLAGDLHGALREP